jgi:hypothetical protein
VDCSVDNDPVKRIGEEVAVPVPGKGFCKTHNCCCPGFRFARFQFASESVPIRKRKGRRTETVPNRAFCSAGA